MATILDYLYWRGDLSLAQVPLNELDGLVLTRFAYLPFERVALGETETIGSLVGKVQALPEETLRLPEDAQLLYHLEQSARFRDLPVTDFIKDNDEDSVKQFCAVTVHLSDEAMYIAFCGTDSTLLGWKEDFYMSFTEDIPAQKSAVAYVTRLADAYPGKQFFIGGHSKGGNLAVYAAVNLDESRKERLLHVSDYDGPGFPKDYIASHDFASVVDRIGTFIPQESVFGRIHDHAEGFSVVNSTARGLDQHNVYTWEVEPAALMLLPEPDQSSEIMYDAIQNILQNTSPEQRKEYVDEVYNILTSADFSSMKEIRQAEPSQVRVLATAVGSLSSEALKEAQEVNNAMFRSLMEAVVSHLEEKLPEPSAIGLLRKRKAES